MSAHNKNHVFFARLIVIFITMGSAHGLFASSTQSTVQGSANQVWGNTATWSNPPSAANFDNPIPIGMGARAIGMGEAFAGLSDDLSGVWYNPAGLTQMNKNEVDWMGGDRYTDDPYSGFLSASYMLQNRMVFALSLERPWNPTGFYPDVTSGVYPGFTTFPGPGLLSIPGTESQSKIPFNTISDTAVQNYLEEVYRTYINPPFQEDEAVFTYATPLSPDQNLSFGINLKYLYNDSEYQAENQLIAEVAGWGLDMGVQYRQPLSTFGKEFSVGLDVRDLAGEVRYGSGLSSGEEVTLAPVTTLGIAWKTHDYITHSDLNLTTDFIYINDPALDDDDDERLYLGGEMWFLEGKIGARAGYRMFFDRLLSGATIGLSFKYLLGLDYAYMFPQDNEGSTNWVTTSYHWGGIVEAPVLPDVSVTVDPPIFAPRNGEFTTFTLSAAAPDGIDHWTLSIIDKNSMVVKSYEDRGDPPAQIIWGGEDKVYRLLPDGEYTYLLTATDHKGNSASTPVQTLRLYTQPTQPVQENEIDALRKLIKKEGDDEEAGDTKATQQAADQLKLVIKKEAANTTIPDIAKAPTEATPLTPLAQARAAAGAFTYARVDDLPFSSSKVITSPDGKKAYTVSFATEQDTPKAILMDIADVMRTAANDVGESVARYDVTAQYGSRQLRVIAPASAAYSLARGFTTREQFLGTSVVTLDGNPISPSYR